MKKTSSSSSSKTSHHHGDLREALIEAGLAILHEHGAAGLSLRRCAARAGVSHAAPAHHFDGLEGLLTSIAARGFRMFTDTMTHDRATAEDDPRKRLLAICHAYLRFAKDNSSLYNLMFSSESLDFGNTELNESSAASYQVLVDGCAPFKAGPGGSTGTEIMIWSLLHGFVGISSKNRHSNPQHPINNTSLEDIFPHLELS